MKKLPACSLGLLVAAIFSVSLLTACGDGTTKAVTTKEDLFETPAPPYHFVPFHNTNEVDGEGWNSDDYINKLPLKSPPAGVDTKVDTLNVLQTGWTKGGLRFNTLARGNYSDPPNMTFPETNDNGTLGPASCGFVYLYYKYEPEITFAGDLKKCCYGAMSTGLISMEEKKPKVIFHDLPVANDEIGREWHCTSSDPVADWKKKFPVVAVEAKTIRWIDCMGGPGGSFGAGWEGKKVYVLIYAGVEKSITQAKIFRFDFPNGKKPTMTEIPTMESLLKEVSTVTYSVDKLTY